jgi:hypothetical protein
MKINLVNVYIETLEDCEFLCSIQKLKRSYLQKQPLERAFRILMQRNLSVTQNRLFDTISKSATDKYLEF